MHRYAAAVLTPADARSILTAEHAHRPVATERGLLFTYQGDLESVELHVMEDRFPAVGPMQKLGEDSIWYVEVEVPPDSVLEYKFAVTRAGETRLLRDPSNPLVAKDPFGTNSMATGPEYQPPRWLEDARPAGKTVPFDVASDVWEQTRHHLLHTPPGYQAARPGTLLILHDGPDYLEYSAFAACIASVVAEDDIEPPLVLLHRPRQRNTEYPDNPQHVAHVNNEILPALRAEHSIDRVVAGGASLGAVAAATLAIRRPGTVDALMLQSGSFVRELGGPYRRGRVLAPAARLTQEMTAETSWLPQTVAMSCGTFDGLVEDNRLLQQILEPEVPRLRYQESHAGHHWRCWRDHLSGDLAWTLRNHDA